jgi:hypothetical protein
MGNITRIKQGDVYISGELNERLPAIQSGLVVYYPFDGTELSGSLFGDGWTGATSANSAIQDLTKSNVPVCGQQTIMFRGWFRKSGGLNGGVTLYCYHQINGSWNWQSASINGDLVDGEWVYLEKSYQVAGLATDTLTNFSQGISLRQDNTIGKLEWQDLNCYVLPSTTNQPLWQSDGLGIDENNTNLWTDQNPACYNNFGVPVTNNLIDEYYLGQQIRRMTYQCTSSSLGSFRGSYANQGYYGNGMTYTGGNTYFASIYWRPSKEDVDVGGTASNIPGWSDVYTEKLAGGWRRSVCKWYDASNRTDNKFWSFRCPSVDVGETITIDWACPQIEQKVFTSTYTVAPGRTGYSYINIDELNLNNFTISFKFKPNAEYYKVMGAGYNFTLVSMYDADLIRRIDYTDYHGSPSPSNTSSASFFDLMPDASWDNAMHHWHHYYGYQMTKWHDYVIVKSGNTLRIYVVLNGNVLVDNTWTYGDSALLTNFVLARLRVGTDGNLQPWSGTVKNLAVYNSALDTSALQILTQARHESLGVMRNNVILEKSLVPSDTVYFPLCENGNSVGNTVAPSELTNPSFYKGAIFIGPSRTNLFTQPTSDNFGVRGNGTYTVEPTTQDGDMTYRFNYNQGVTYGYRGWDIACAVGDVFTVSFDAFISSDKDDFAYSFIANCEQALSYGFNYDTSKVGTWQSFVYTGTASTTNLRVLFYPTQSTVNGSKGYILYRNMQVEKTSFATPFINGSRGASYLEYNLNSSYALDWSKDWSIVYWKKPIGTYTGTMTAYNIESLGSNSNSVGGGYIWWGKTNSSNDINGTGVSFNPSTNYFNKWQMVALLKTGTTINIRTYLPDGTLAIRTDSTTNTVANYYVSQYGYDFKLGGWDSGQETNTFFRDLLLFRRCLSSVEADTLYKRFYKQSGSKIYVQGNLIEGVSL